MKIYLLSLVHFFWMFSSYGQDSLKVGNAIRVGKPPKIDGKLDDEVWKNAAVIHDFVQGRPVENAVPTFVTEAKIIYDNTAIYIGVFMHDSAPDSILHELGIRDQNDLNADLVQIKFDPYDVRQDAFVFGVYASGVQQDSKWSDGTFNAVWSSAVEINHEGWVAEFKIPYSAIRFPKKEIQQWALQIVRSIRRTREYDQWAYTPSGVANPLNYWGKLMGMSHIETPLRLSMTPYLSGYIENTPYLDAEEKTSYSNSYSYNAGADIKYGIDDRFTLDLTLLPDFGQVQSDNKIKNLSFREVTYDENRSFFKEGTDLFSKNDLFYSRRIGKIPNGFYRLASELNPGDSIISNPSQVKILNAAKISGRTNNGLGIGVLNAVTQDMYAIVQDSSGTRRKVLTEPFTNYNIVVLDQQLKNNSNIYFINTNVMRDKTFNHANVTSSGFTFYNQKSTYAIDAIGILSQRFSKTEGSQENYTDQLGYKYFFGIHKASGKFQYGLSRVVTSSGMHTSDFGYQTIPNVVNNHAYAEYFLFKPWKIFRDADNSMNVNYATHYLTKKPTLLEFNYHGYATLLSYNSIYGGGGIAPMITLDYNEPRVPGRYAKNLRYFYLYAGISSDYRKKIAVDLSQNLSNFLDNYKSEGLNTDFGIRYRATDKLNLKYIFSFYYDPFNLGFVDIDPEENIIYGGRKLYTYINRLEVNYIFKKDMTLSVIGRHYWNKGVYKKYFTVLEDGSYANNMNYATNNDFSYNAFNVDIAYVWIFAPGSQLSLVYKNAIENEQPLRFNRFGENFRNTITSPQNNSLSLKVLYYLDYSYLKKKSI